MRQHLPFRRVFAFVRYYHYLRYPWVFLRQTFHPGKIGFAFVRYYHYLKYLWTFLCHFLSHLISLATKAFIHVSTKSGFSNDKVFSLGDASVVKSSVFRVTIQCLCVIFFLLLIGVVIFPGYSSCVNWLIYILPHLPRIFIECCDECYHFGLKRERSWNVFSTQELTACPTISKMKSWMNSAKLNEYEEGKKTEFRKKKR